MTPSVSGAAARGARFDRLDALRGVAIVWMAVFHFAFDLAHHGYTSSDFRHDPFWLHQRTAIVTLFLLCAGAGQAIATAQGQSTARFWKRWAQVAACAVLVTLGSWWMFPRSVITFGVLHGIAVMLVVVRFTSGLGAWRWPLGLAAMVAPLAFHHPFFDTRWTNGLGFVTRLPVTEDYVPVFPWLGVMWWGAAAADALLRHRRDLLAAGLAPVARPLAVLGRWSLSFYMLHQPVLLGALLAWRALAG